MERFHWEADPEEPVEGAPLGGEWTAAYDDATGEVTTTRPEAEPVVRPYSAAELTERAAKINALRALREAQHIVQVLDQTRAQLDTELAEQSARIDAATAIISSTDRKVTVSTEPPATVEGFPEGALWEQCSAEGVTLARWYVIDGAWVQGEILGNLIVPGTIDATKVRMDEAWANKIAANMGAFQEAFIGKLSALAIEASTFDGYTIRGAEIISPSETGEIRLTDNTLTVERMAGEDGLQTTTSLGGVEDDQLALTPLGSASPTVVLSGATGDASFAGEVSVGSLTVDGRPLSELIDPLPRGVIGMTWGSGSALPDIGQSEYGLVRFMGRVEAGRRYRFSADLKLQGTAGDTVELLLRQSLDAGGATVNSARLAAWRESIPTGGIGAASLSRSFNVTESSDSFSLLLSMRNWSANTRPVRLWSDGGSDQSQSFFVLEDIGAIRAGMGALWTGAGGTPYAGQTAPPPPPETKRTYTKTYTASAVRSWRGSTTVTSELGHGTYGGYKRVSQILFPASVKTDLAGATNIRARVKLTNIHTWAGSGMTAYLSPGTQTSLASSPATSPNGATAHWGKGQTKLETVPGWGGSHQSVWLGIGAPGGNTYYGKFSPKLSSIVLELTYDK